VPGLEGMDRSGMDVVREDGRAAHVEELVRRPPDGYRTVVGERGLKLSEGTRRRVAIERAMAKAAPMLILDEAPLGSIPIPRSWSKTRCGG
jgi:ABC-type transport system involved in Fe-S cluster assembly fused permease/ATPase subunit